MTLFNRTLTACSWSVLTVMVAIVSACATHPEAHFRTGWVTDILPGAAVTRTDSSPCVAGKTPEEIAKLTWVVVSVAHLRSVRSVTLPLSPQFTPRRGERVLVDVTACRVMSAT